MSDLTPPTEGPVMGIAPKLAVDAKGYVWRVFPPDDVIDEEIWSMAPVNPDNSPIPEPVTYYYPVTPPTRRWLRKAAGQ